MAVLSPPVRVPSGARSHDGQTTLTGPDAFGRAVIDSVINRKGLSFSLDTSSNAEMLEVSSKLEAFLLTIAGFTGGDMVRIAPGFMQDTFPAMVALTAKLNRDWSSRDQRTIQVGEARLLFVSVDRPSIGSADAPSRPDLLLEVAHADRVASAWYESRVAPRIKHESASDLTLVFYGRSRSSELSGAFQRSAFHRAATLHRRLQERDGIQRHFEASPEEARPRAWDPLELAAAV
jgi:hypothetical protein